MSLEHSRINPGVDHLLQPHNKRLQEGSLPQVHRTFSRYDAWMKKQEPYVQAILAWHNTGANKHLFFQSRWVWRGRNFPAAYLETCCADGTPVPLSNQPGCTFPSREACESFCLVHCIGHQLCHAHPRQSTSCCQRQSSEHYTPDLVFSTSTHFLRWLQLCLWRRLNSWL